MPFIWQISIVNFKKSSMLQGVILEGEAPVQKTTNSFTTVIGSYFKKNYANQEIVISIDGKRHNLNTDDKGGFSLELDKPASNNFEIFPKGSSKSFKVLQSYPVVFNDTSFPLSIISDIDDTILISNTLNFWKRVSTLLFVSPNKRKSISFTKEILNKISTQKGRVFYVSKSESNLFALLTTFIKKHNLPEGNLMLTPYIRFNRLLSPKKGKDFKERMIRSVMDHSPSKKFILMGDDTQGDILVYTKIAELYPEKIFKIYIRKTQKNLLGNKQQQLDKLMKLAVPVLYFTDSSDVLKEINLIENHKNLRL
jgi:phosphatidate phosphatase APP1